VLGERGRKHRDVGTGLGDAERSVGRLLEGAAEFEVVIPQLEL